MKTGKQIEEGRYVRIPGYPLYEIDQFGNIRRIFKTKRVLITPVIKRGIYVIRLQNPDGQRKEERIHKLMQRTFLPEPKPGQVLYHKNQNRLDNALSNLAYIERSKLGRLTGAKSRRKPVVKIDRTGEIVDVYKSAREAARRNWLSYQTVMDRCNGKVKSRFAPDGYRYEWDEAE